MSSSSFVAMLSRPAGITVSDAIATSDDSTSARSCFSFVKMHVRMRSTPASIIPWPRRESFEQLVMKRQPSSRIASFSLCFRITSMMNSRLPEFEMNDVSPDAQRARIDTHDSTSALSSGKRLIERIDASGVEHSIRHARHASCVATCDSSFSPFSWICRSSKKRSTASSQIAMPFSSITRFAFFTSVDR